LGVFFIEVKTVFNSDWTLLRTCGDLAKAAEYAALEYLRAILDAARRPRPCEMAAEDWSIIV
jgi:hypothetical protein